MKGIKIDEFYELISHCHEAEFEYVDTTYVLQPEVEDNKDYLVIWDCTHEATKCICKHEIGEGEDISRDVIEAVLSEKCFGGKSFLEIEQDITITVIF
jgi:hypothetical protein